MKIIISGAVTNDPNYMEKFAAAEKKLKEKFPESIIFNPAKSCNRMLRAGIYPIYGMTDNQIWLQCMLFCLAKFNNATHIYYIDDFTESDGREIERITAKHMGLIEIQEELK